MSLEPIDDTFYIKQGNNLPLLQAQLTDEDNSPLDLEFSERVMFRMFDPRTGDTLFMRDASVVNETRGVVQYIWQDGDTSNPGRYRSEFIVLYPSGKSESFPNFGYKDIMVWGTVNRPDVGEDVDIGFPSGE